VITRRHFVQGASLAGLGVLAGCGRLPGQTEPAAKVSRIGVLSQSADPADANNLAFRQGLRDLGYSEGHNLVLEWRYLDNQIERYPEQAANLVRRSIDVIVAQGSAAALAAKQVSATLPIIMAYSSEPVQAGLVASLARPGGNVTGLAAITGQLEGKRLELLRDAVPGLARVALLWTPESAERAHELDETAAAARALGLALQSVELRPEGNLEDAFDRILQGRADALFVQTNPVTNRYRLEIAEFSIAHRLPVSSSRKELVVAGSLMSYGPNFADMNRRAAYYVDRILQGAQPDDLPVEQPTTFEFVINLKTAEALGLAIPEHVLRQATEIIQ
jgi:putative tryptophan/tyrosine transport system substrate-binding protein